MVNFAAWLFVVIWATGFVVARGISGLIDPYLFLLVRFTSVLIIFSAAMLVMRSALPNSAERWRLLGIGALMQGLYLGPGFWAVSAGLEAGVMALVGTLQPPLTAVLAWYFFKEQIGKQVIIGLLIGICGVVLAIAPGLTNQTSSNDISVWVMTAAVMSIGSITAGTLLQKSSIVSVPLLSSVTFQTLGAVIVMLPMAIVLGDWVFPFTPTAFAYLSYAVVVLSIGGFTLFTWMVRTGSATRASSLLLLVPPLAALLAWQLYDEALGLQQLTGFALALAGVLMARSQKGLAT